MVSDVESLQKCHHEKISSFNLGPNLPKRKRNRTNNIPVDLTHVALCVKIEMTRQGSKEEVRELRREREELRSSGF